MDVRRVRACSRTAPSSSAAIRRVKIVKNKVAPPFKQAEFDIMYGQGISRTSELVDLGVEYGIVNKSGAWFSMGDTRLGQGRDAAKQYFNDHPDIANDVQRQIMEKVEEGGAARTPQRSARSPRRASRPPRRKSLPHPSRPRRRRFRSTRTILTTSTTKNEHG